MTTDRADSLAQEVFSLIKETIDRQKEETDLWNNRIETLVATVTSALGCSATRPASAPAAATRREIVENVCLPLLSCLTHCYAVLDASSPQQLPTAAKQAPLGLISLQHFTDVAALTEFTICLSGIRPVNPLPKALAGRLQPRLWSRWPEEQSPQSILRSTAEHVARLLLLDRFRQPLARHWIDIYSVLMRASDSPLGDDLGLRDPSKSQVDALTRARVYAQLLSKVIPQAKQHLTQLACVDLAAVVAVLVPLQDVATASLRLAHALVSTVQDWDALGRQCLGLLDSVPLSDQVPPLAVARVEVVRALWALAPEHSPWKEDLTVGRQGRLLLVLPSSLDPIPLLRWSLLSDLVRKATVHTVIESPEKLEARVVLKLWVNAVLQSRLKEQLLVLSLVYAVTPNEWDVGGNRYEGGVDGSLGVTLGSHVDMKLLTEAVEHRARFVVTELIVETGDSVPFEAFRLLLSMLFGGVSPRSMDETFARITAFVALPILCEECPPDSLLQSESGFGGLVELMQLTFMSLANTCGEEDCDVGTDGLADCFNAADDFLAQAVGQPSRMLPDDNLPMLDSTELLVSVASLLLSLLVATLELGTASDDTLACVDTLMPSLRRLAERSGASHQTKSHETSSMSLSEIAEVSSHALALIASRAAHSNVTEREESEEAVDASPVARLDLAETDLSSDEPPIRARGVVSLRHVASYLEDIARQGGSTNVSDLESLQDRIMQLSMKALLDQESYVYLAAVQTLAVAANIDPSRAIRSLGDVVTRGQSSIFPDIHVTDELRVKLTESLVAVLHRRAAIGEHVVSLLALLLCPGKEQKDADSSRIHTETHLYFVGDENSANDMQTRLRAGGPIFSTEEPALVRSSMINIVTTLVAVAETHMVAPYGSILIDCSIETLELSMARPIRRSAANLASELYAALLREQEALLDGIESGKEVDVPLSTALANSSEEALRALLERCVHAQDWNESRLYDPATVARCEEALSLRKEVMEGGVLRAGKLLAKSRKEAGKSPFANMATATRGPIIEDLS